MIVYPPGTSETLPSKLSEMPIILDLTTLIFIQRLEFIPGARAETRGFVQGAAPLLPEGPGFDETPNSVATRRSNQQLPFIDNRYVRQPGRGRM